MQAASQGGPLSHYGIAGIHGLPYVSWEGAGSSSSNRDQDFAWDGYCTHGNVLFPTWHRLYVALHEVKLCYLYLLYAILILIQSYSKCYNSTLLRSLRPTSRTKICGWRQHKPFEPHIGTGWWTYYHLPRLFHWRTSALLDLMANQLMS